MEILKPCPFCGSEAKLIKVGIQFKIRCKKWACEASNIKFDSLNMAIETWNTRTSGWISVADEIPNKRLDWYLISFNCNAPHEIVVTMAFLDSDEDGNPLWLIHNDHERLGDYDEWEDVTHWMTLPQPPEIDND